MHLTTDVQCFLNSQVLPLSKAYLHVSDLAIQRGYGVFDFFKVQAGSPLFLDEYLERFNESARQMELTVPLTVDALKEVIFELIEKNKLAQSGIKIILTGGYAADGYTPVAPNLLLIQQPLHLPDQVVIEKGIKAMSYEYVRELPSVKTINYSMGIRLLKQLKESGAQDVLYHQHGVVTEFPRCNFFIVKQDNTIVTPAHNILLGVTRKHIVKLASKKYKIEEATVTLQDVYQAKEAFLTSTTKRVLPVVQLDAKVIGNGQPGPVTLSLLQDLISFEKENLQTA